ncbi:hypothetical protein FSP39_011267 [Pinctada imbricata]|uniref:Elongation factor 1-delta-like n=1 Tax=Pinctada imbricata TaxID=66713 RepID=A0AA88XP00_PINIB|nr:hypothetical protein FSP39_011267 [Pinctada imbricata]
MASHPLMFDSVWRDQQKYEDAERVYRQHLSGVKSTTTQSAQDNKPASGSSLKNEIAQARQHIQNFLSSGSSASGSDEQVMKRVETLEKENKELKKVVDDMRALVQRLEGRVSSLEKGTGTAAPASTNKPTPAATANGDDDDDDDDIDLFGSDEEEDAEAARIREERLAEYAKKKAGKKAIIAKSSLLLDVKPWDDETDMKVLEQEVRKITCDGLIWGASKFIPVGYGIKKLQINCVIEDDKVSTDFLEEEITAIEEYVQSMDVAAFNKI